MDFSDLGEYHGDGVPPDGAEARSHGIFWDPEDMFEYLARGGLAEIDEFGNVLKHPAVHIVKMTDPDFDEEFHQVYIDDEY